jgi:hypothetical protein
MRWTRLPETPNAPGVGGPSPGVTGESLLCAGGSNFPAKPACEGAVAKVCATASGPRPRHHLRLQEVDGRRQASPPDRLRRRRLDPSRPPRRSAGQRMPTAITPTATCSPAGGRTRGPAASRSCAPGLRHRQRSSAARSSSPAGTERPDATVASSTAYRAWTSRTSTPAGRDCRWRRLGTHARPVRGHQGHLLPLRRRRRLPRGQGRRTREYLDGLPCVHARQGEWRRLAPLPRGAAAAPSPLPVAREGEFLVLGGDDSGKLAGKVEPCSSIPASPRRVLGYDPAADACRPPSARAPAPMVTTSCARRRPAVLRSSTAGLRPCTRSTEGWLVQPRSKVGLAEVPTGP